MNNHCRYCKRIMTNNEQLSTLNSFHYTYVDDVVDDSLQIPGIGHLTVSICDECRAKKDFDMIVNCIRNDINYYRENLSGDIQYPETYLEKRFKQLKEKWLSYVTENVNLNRNTYWHELLNNEINNLKLNEILTKNEKT